MNLVENIINQFKSNEARFDTIEEAIEAIKKGGMVIVADDESRENELRTTPTLKALRSHRALMLTRNSG